MQHDRKFIPDAEVFTQAPRITLADVLARVEKEYTGSALRDTRSAFRALERRVGIDLGCAIATPTILRDIFSGLRPVSLGVGEKRFANICSSVTQAARRYGQPRTWITSEIAPAPEWQVLLDQIADDQQYRWGLSRLACYCSVKGIVPEAVTVETLRGLFAALEAEAVSKDPRNLLKRTISCWNHCRRSVPGWPKTRLSSPFKTAPYMLTLEAFPESFQQDIGNWETRMRNPDPLDPKAPVRACRPDTLQGYRFTFRRLATALVRSGLVPMEHVTGLDVFFTEENFKAALRPFLKGERVKTDGYAHKMATQLLSAGKQHLGLDESELAPFQAIVQRLKPAHGPSMGERNRALLAQFDDEAVVVRLLGFPREELGRALKIANPVRRAKGVERALAISLAIFTGLRVKNLRQLRLDQNIRRSGHRVFVRIAQDEAKTHTSLELELPCETIELLGLFLAEHRGLIPGADSPYLFPGGTGLARSYSAMRDALSKPLWRHAGIRLSPHLYRHIIAKIVVERRPELALDVSRRLGHKSVNTTYQSYLGTEGPAASRRINTLLTGLRDDGDKRQ
ncbi:Site-specific recombinase XerD [Cribrihabitans marinus]|uniref:Site-specific recombinase XerD n=1 Tax=Cribrihabitans marinus TaxID=1227549 RepID=A0A1H7E1G4_9RHOB|nr:site-specific integrase [Cribrihabitans marinus]GGH41563.1 hypothetical protein GCM10010973_38570 [Cribrihabitans marinus]SEK07806.1 Site-specific recombinase XerD [Cribrihabitans marinus]